MNMSDEEFKKLYSNLAPETQADLRKQLEMDQPGVPIVPQRIAPQRQRKIRPRHKHLWGWIIIGYGLLILSCILPALLKMK